MIVLTFAECNVDQAGSEKWPEETRDWLEIGEPFVLLANWRVNQEVFKSAAEMQFRRNEASTHTLPYYFSLNKHALSW